MDKQVILLSKGGKFQSQGLDKFAKDILVQGLHTHPTTGKTVDLSDPARLQRLAHNTALYRKNGNKVPFPDGHTFDAMKNLGDWDDTFIVQDGRLWGMVNAKAPGAAERMAAGSIDGVSAYIEFGVTDSKGNKYDEVITHICATDYPVVGGQKQFIPLSKVGDLEVPIFLSRDLTGISPEGHISEDPMLKKIAVALGLPEDAGEDKVLAAVAKNATDNKTFADKLKAQEGLSAVKPEELKAHGLELKDGKVVKLSAPPVPPESPEMLALRQENELLRLSAAKDRLNTAKAKAEALAKAGLLPPALTEKLSKLFALKDKVEAMALSSDGKSITGEPIDVEATLNEILSSVKGITGSRLKVLRPVDGEPAEKTPEQLAKEGAELAREAQGRKKETA